LTEQLGREPLARMCDPTPDSLADAINRLAIDPPPIIMTSEDPGSAWRTTAATLVRHIPRTVERSVAMAARSN
jgi:hypothetical protein